MFKILANLFKALNSNSKPEEIMLGAVMGMFCGLVMLTPFNFIFFTLLMFLLNANSGIYAMYALLFKLIALFIDPVGDTVGYFVLTQDFLNPLFTQMARLPIIPFTGFNNTVIMGNFIIGIVLVLPVWLTAGKLVKFYRDKLQKKVEKLKIVQLMKVTDITGKITDIGKR